MPLTNERESNTFYTQMKHINDFLYRKDNFKMPDQTISIDYSIEKMSAKESKVSMDAFKHTSDVFKKAKESLRQKGEI
ncbi:Uncharacterised protein [Staphylococcus devriesei]|nr:hypothetical protein [Staphylococcus devriesei]SUM03798.1 Uncharacterised protein [Staphylococcus devriesei]